MGANMQCNGHFPGYYSTRDLIFGAEGTSWTSSNGNSELKNDCYQIGSLPLSSSCHLLAYDKELLKQTILKHETIFRDQVCELRGSFYVFCLAHLCKLLQELSFCFIKKKYG